MLEVFQNIAIVAGFTYVVARTINFAESAQRTKRRMESIELLYGRRNK